LRLLPHLQALRLFGVELNPAALKSLKKLQNLEELVLFGPLGNTEVDEIAPAERIRVLKLFFPGLEENVKRFDSLPELRRLFIGHTAISQDQARIIGKAGGLDHIELVDCNLSDACLMELCSLKNLKNLYLTDNPITDPGLRVLRDLHGLRELSLAGTRISDHGLKNLSSLRELRNLNLSWTKVTDEGVKALSGLDLQAIDISHTGISSKGSTLLKTLFPGIRILRSE